MSAQSFNWNISYDVLNTFEIIWGFIHLIENIFIYHLIINVDL